jgi:hypothetical protein
MTRSALLVAISGLLVCGCTEAAKKHNAAARSKFGENAETKTAAANNQTETNAAAEQPKHEEKLPTEKIVKAAEPAPTEEILLGTADLTHGIAGTGPLKRAEIENGLLIRRTTRC